MACRSATAEWRLALIAEMAVTWPKVEPGWSYASISTWNIYNVFWRWYLTLENWRQCPGWWSASKRLLLSLARSRFVVLLFANRAQIVELGMVFCLCTFKANTICNYTSFLQKKTHRGLNCREYLQLQFILYQRKNISNVLRSLGLMFEIFKIRQFP